MSKLTRRTFLHTTALAATYAALPLKARAFAPSDRIRTAHIGVGGMGGADLNSISTHPAVQVVALCDVDANNLNRAGEKFPDAKRFADYRKLFDELADQIDAVVVSTPDHTHAPAAMSALNAGKHVYCQKPLTHEVYEARRLREVAEQKKLVTQMGIQVHGSHPYRLATAIIQDGAIGKVREVHAWSNKNWGYDGGPIEGSGQVPATLDWDLWLGVAPERPYAPNFHPGNWRRFIDYGTGTLGDMGVHIFDTPYRALKLTAPKWAKTTCRKPTGVGHPTRNKVEYEFPGTQYTTDTLRWVWYDGEWAPPAELKDLVPEVQNLPGQASLFIGEKGVMLLPHVGQPILSPKKDFADYIPPMITPVNHYHQWVDACLGRTEASANFSYAGPLTEALLLGVVANRFPEQRLEWDAAELKVTNLPEANQLIRRQYRKGFEVENL